jgi:hypothetical protein
VLRLLIANYKATLRASILKSVVKRYSVFYVGVLF